MDSFTPIPNEWVDSLADGRLTMPMFTILCYLKRTCIWKTGVWRGTAERIQHGLNGEIKARQIQRYLKRVGVCGYISSHHIRGVRRSYKIDLNNYVAHHDGEDLLLRPTELKDWQELPEVDDGDDDAHDDGEMTVRRRGDDAHDDGVMTRIPDVLDVPDEIDELDGLDHIENPNQLTNQSINPSGATLPTAGKASQTLKCFEEGVIWQSNATDDWELTPVEKESLTRKEIRNCWWSYKNPTESDLKLMYEVLLVLWVDGRCIAEPKDLVDYTHQHFGGRAKTKGMVIRDCHGLWKAVCGPGVSQTNGLLYQFNECIAYPCKACKVPTDGSRQIWTTPAPAPHPIAPPPPPINTCETCGAKFESTGPMAASRNCRACKTKRGEEAYNRMVADGTIRPQKSEPRLAAFLDGE